ncbi:MAG: hypothetical protein ACRDBM_06720 [Sporomusa sp.]
MTGEATVFSQVRRIELESFSTAVECEQRLRHFVELLGKALSHNGIILGHIKVLAKLPAFDDEHFLVLSLTRLDSVDITLSEHWREGDGVNLRSLELHINVLVFGYTLHQVEAAIHSGLLTLGSGPVHYDNNAK